MGRLKYSCKYAGCPNSYMVNETGKEHINKHYFSLPKDPELKKKWKEACGITPQQNATSFRICQDHFTDNSFINLKKERLIHRAIPISIKSNSNSKSKAPKPNEDISQLMLGHYEFCECQTSTPNITVNNNEINVQQESDLSLCTTNTLVDHDYFATTSESSGSASIMEPIVYNSYIEGDNATSNNVVITIWDQATSPVYATTETDCTTENGPILHQPVQIDCNTKTTGEGVRCSATTNPISQIPIKTNKNNEVLLNAENMTVVDEIANPILNILSECTTEHRIVANHIKSPILHQPLKTDFDIESVAAECQTSTCNITVNNNEINTQQESDFSFYTTNHNNPLIDHDYFTTTSDSIMEPIVYKSVETDATSSDVVINYIRPIWDQPISTVWVATETDSIMETEVVAKGISPILHQPVKIDCNTTTAVEGVRCGAIINPISHIPIKINYNVENEIVDESVQQCTTEHRTGPNDIESQILPTTGSAAVVNDISPILHRPIKTEWNAENMIVADEIVSPNAMQTTEDLAVANDIISPILHQPIKTESILYSEDGAEVIVSRTLNVPKKKGILAKIGAKLKDLSPREALLYRAQRNAMSKLCKLQKAIAEERTKVKILQRQCKKLELIGTNCNTATRAFINSQLRNVKVPPTARRFTHYDTSFALSMYLNGPKLYRFLRSHFQLPSVRGLKQFKNS